MTTIRRAHESHPEFTSPDASLETLCRAYAYARWTLCFGGLAMLCGLLMCLLDSSTNSMTLNWNSFHLTFTNAMPGSMLSVGGLIFAYVTRPRPDRYLSLHPHGAR